MANAEMTENLKSAAGNLSLQPEERAAILAACEMLTPAKAVDVEYSKDRHYAIGCCPKCGSVGVEGMSFCDNCGQALDWGVEE